MRLVVLTLTVGLAVFGLSRSDWIARGSANPSRMDESRSASADAVCSRYAAPWGRDSAAGTRKHPFRSAQRLADSLRRGGTGCLRGGTYRELDDVYVLEIRRRGSASAPLTIRSAPRERAKLVGIVTVTARSERVTLQRLAIEGTGRMNAVKVYAADFVLRDSVVTTAGRDHSCVYLGRGAVRTVIRRNRFHDCGHPGTNKDHAIYAAHAVNGIITANVFWSHAGRAVQLYPDAQRNLVTGNVIDGGPPSIRGGIVIGGEGGWVSNGNIVERNVIAFAVTYNVYSNWDDIVGQGNVVRFNCVWGGKLGDIDYPGDGGFESHSNTVAPPMFANRKKRDYRLLPKSECHDVLRGDVGD